MSSQASLEWLGAATFRLKFCGLIVFHDAWLLRPSAMKVPLRLEDVDEVDYILISHAHFDHLPGADKLAIKTGAKIIANCEAINCLRGAGVPEDQLIAVQGGERVPLFPRSIHKAAVEGTMKRAPGPPLAPPRPHPELAVAAVHVWPALHCLIPWARHEDFPDEFDTGIAYTGENIPGFDSTLDMNFGMQHGLLRLKDMIPAEHMDPNTRSFAEFVADRDAHCLSHHDGGQLMYNIVGQGKAVLFHAHMGAYDGIIANIEPKPNVAILGAVGRANLNGRPFHGSAADFLTKEVKWLGEPEKVFFCLHDRCLIKPFTTNDSAAKAAIHANTSSTVIDLEVLEPHILF